MQVKRFERIGRKNKYDCMAEREARVWGSVGIGGTRELQENAGNAIEGMGGGKAVGEYQASIEMGEAAVNLLRVYDVPYITYSQYATVGNS